VVETHVSAKFYSRMTESGSEPEPILLKMKSKRFQQRRSSYRWTAGTHAIFPAVLPRTTCLVANRTIYCIRTQINLCLFIMSICLVNTRIRAKE
jgi:hypothetical protein